MNAFRLQVLVANRTFRDDQEAATLEQIAKWTALQLRWPIFGEAVKKSPDLLLELEQSAMAEEPAAEPHWPEPVQKLYQDGEFQNALRAEPLLERSDLHGLLPIT
ncbi:MAG: hypothetical protein CL878_14740 [Dehalococcoidia bacterium]|nr:hypothetical protein [Dehalococcoidia bacterium]